jgi:hypothetical protein
MLAGAFPQASALDSGQGDDLDRLLGDRAIFMLREASEKLRISVPSLYRGMRLGRIPYVMNGNRRMLTRPVMKRLLREGVGQLANKSIERNARRSVAGAPESAGDPTSAERRGTLSTFRGAQPGQWRGLRPEVRNVLKPPSN